MMYVSVYPIAMSVRATNVYEERSLGMFEEDDVDTDDGEDDYKAHIQEGKVAGWTRYLAFHARRQLAFDMWWLGASLCQQPYRLSETLTFRASQVSHSGSSASLSAVRSTIRRTRPPSTSSISSSSSSVATARSG
jgi:hypothetical protein